MHKTIVEQDRYKKEDVLFRSIGVVHLDLEFHLNFEL
jgi:hypothetical protein